MPSFSGIVVATGVEASGRTIFLDVIEEMARPIDASDSTVRDSAADAFRAAVRKMNRKGCWPWEILDEEITLTANQNLVTVNFNIKKPLAFHYLNQSGGTRDAKIAYIDYRTFVEKYTVNLSGKPWSYTIPNQFETGQIRVYPTPASNYTAMLTYYRVTPPPKNEQEALEIPDTALECYKALAWVEFLKRLTASQRPFSIDVAMLDARNAFREMTAFVENPGDQSRQVNLGWYGG